MKHVEEISPHCYSFTRWKHFPLIAVFSDSAYNFSHDTAITEKNLFLSHVGLNINSVIFPQQVHGAGVSIVGKGSPQTVLARDGLISSERDVPIAILTADCAPLFFYAPRTNVIGIVHAGWRGIRDGIIHSTLDTMTNNFRVNTKDIHVACGPAIRSCCYEVGEDVSHYFNSGVTHKDSRIFLDLPEVIKSELCEHGVLAHNIIDSELCTHCLQDTFFSYRREGENTGRILSLIMLK